MANITLVVNKPGNVGTDPVATGVLMKATATNSHFFKNDGKTFIWLASTAAGVVVTIKTPFTLSKCVCVSVIFCLSLSQSVCVCFSLTVCVCVSLSVVCISLTLCVFGCLSHCLCVCL